MSGSAPPTRRRRHRSRRRPRSSGRARRPRQSAPRRFPCPATRRGPAAGRGCSGQGKAAASGPGTPRAASTRHTGSGSPVSCASRALARSASASGPTQRRPVREEETPRKAKTLGRVAVFHPPDRPRLGPHQKRLGGQETDLALDPGQERAVGDPRGGKDDIRRHHVVARVDPVQVLDAGLLGALLLVVVAETTACQTSVRPCI